MTTTSNSGSGSGPLHPDLPQRRSSHVEVLVLPDVDGKPVDLDQLAVIQPVPDHILSGCLAAVRPVAPGRAQRTLARDARSKTSIDMYCALPPRGGDCPAPMI